MTYDMRELRDRVEERRRGLIRSVVFLLIFIICGVTVAIAVDETTVRFVGAAVALILLCVLIRILQKNRPVSLFSREIRGVNVKEHEYVIRGRRAYSRYLGFYQSRRPDPTTPRGIIGAVYILEESGDVIIVDHLNKAHTDIYEDGDKLLKPEGARYPIVVGREVRRQPCPLCGEVNTEEQVRCAVCGLGIIKGVEP